MFKKYVKIAFAVFMAICIAALFYPFRWLGIFVGAARDAFISGYQEGGESIADFLDDIGDLK